MPSLRDPKKNVGEQTTDVPSGLGDAIQRRRDDPTELRGEYPAPSTMNPEATRVEDPASSEKGKFTPRNFAEYELLEEVARGGMGIVFKARHRTLHRIVALKMILNGTMASATIVQRFYQEARAAAALDHPHIVPIYDIDQENGQHYFTMAFIEGTNLKALVADRGPLPIPEALALMEPIVDAVAFAHGQGIIHRDLKPDNVLIDTQGRPRITDFGLAKRILEADPNLTGPGEVLGTPAYMAPEQALGGNRPIGPEADVYALGGLLFFLVTAQAPFAGATITEVLAKVITASPTLPSTLNPTVSGAVDVLCLRCLEKDPARRYPSALAFAVALKALANSASVDSPAARGGKSRAWPLMGVGLALVLLAGGLLFLQDFWANGDSPLVEETRDSGRGGDRGQPTPALRQPVPMQLVVGGRNDFGLKADMIGSRPGAQLARHLYEQDQIAFRIEVERDAYVGVWTIDSDGNITQVFPNAFETDQLFRANQPRTIPSAAYTIEAVLSQGLEEVRVVASTRPWKQLDGRRIGAYQVFQSAEERAQWESHRRGMVLKAVPKGQTAPDVAEGFLKVQVFPRPR